jgi:transcriptional regulator with XRE-family HTH domain
MHFTAAQCRAARSLLNWTQGQLAANAVVSRATIANFESSTRQPIKNNLRSIRDCMFAAGVEFISEENEKGVGVRFRERKLEYVSNVTP